MIDYSKIVSVLYPDLGGVEMDNPFDYVEIRWPNENKPTEQELIDGYNSYLSEQEIPQKLKDYRDNFVQNQTITLNNSAILKVNDRTRRDIADVVDGMLAANIEEYTGWNAVNGRYTMTIADFQEAKVKGLQVVAQVFGAYNSVIDTHESTPYTSFEDAKSAFDSELKKG